MQDLAGGCSLCLALSNSPPIGRISIRLALSFVQGSAATHRPLNESSSFGALATGGREQRLFVNSHGVELILPSVCRILKAISAAEQKGSGLRD